MSDFVIKDSVLTKYRGKETHVVIPEGVTRIGNDAFFGRDNLISVLLPEGITTIGEQAFLDAVVCRTSHFLKA